ncbi:MAG: hypothetical protein N4J56_007564 [Chroococcidiopsis sp. SAG 2025]|nr:hypothetical protein [Chroococcidiopsis sp. SAG 2025]
MTFLVDYNLDGYALVLLGILAKHGWLVGDHSADTFRPLWAIVSQWKCFFYVTDGWSVYQALYSRWRPDHQ